MPSGLRKTQLSAFFKKHHIRPLQTKKTGMQKVIFPGMWEGDRGWTWCSQSEGTRGQLSRWDYVVEDEKGRVPKKYGDRHRGWGSVKWGLMRRGDGRRRLAWPRCREITARVGLSSGLELRGELPWAPGQRWKDTWARGKTLIAGAPTTVYAWNTQYPNKVDSGIFRASMYCLGPQGEAFCSQLYVPWVSASCPEFLSCVWG